jgi:hypothetical protein
MNSRRIVFATIAALLLVAGLWAIPTATTAQQTPAAQLSVSGTITSVEKDSFNLAVGGQTPGGQQLSASEAKSMTFMIDKNTTVEGKLKVNANADVTYREENGKNIAISVHVAS